MKRVVLAIAVIVSVAAVTTWFATGRHYYTKYQVVEHVKEPLGEADPLAGTGFYDDDAAVVTTVTRDEFHLGLLPTPHGLFDKHMLSALSIIGVTWGGSLLLLWWARRREKRGRHAVA